MHHGGAADDVVFHIDGDPAVFLGCQVVQHMTDIGGVECRALRCHPAWEIGIADNLHAIVGGDDLVGDGQVAVAALFRRKVDDNRTRLHQRDHFGRPQFRCRPAWDQRCGDHDVDFRGLFAEQRHFLFDEFWRGRFRVAALSRSVLLEFQHQEFGAHGFDLFGDLGANVESADNRAKRSRGADGGKAGDAGADHQNFGRWYLAGGGDLAGEEPAELVAGLDHGAIAGDVRH